MADDTTILEGSVKFRQGRKWKSRWCVIRKLSPVADCVQLQLYSAAGPVREGPVSEGAVWAWCAGGPLAAQRHTLVLVCVRVVLVLALESREALAQWQARLRPHLGPARTHLMLLCAAPRTRPGPARLLLQRGRVALLAGLPPRLLGLWDLAHLRRYGVVEGRFCFEGGSQCGEGEGLHVLVTDRAHEINRDFDLALRERLSPGGRLSAPKETEGSRSPNLHRAYRPGARLSELNNIERPLAPDVRQYEGAGPGYHSGATTPCWLSAEQHRAAQAGPGDTASVHEGQEGGAAWGGARAVMLARCHSCMSALGARSCSTPHTPGAAQFSPTWTMEPLPEACPEPLPRHGSEPDVVDGSKECRCLERGPGRPPKPTRLDLDLENPVRCGCAHTAPAAGCSGPYDNYDVPRLPSAEVDGEYYDTPKRLKECLHKELFKVTRSSTENSLILKKPCGCLLKLGKRPEELTIIDAEENIQPANCACRRVTDWAHNWIKLPYCRKNSAISSDNLVPNKENVIPNSGDSSAIYATIDLSRKTRRKGCPFGHHDDEHLGACEQNRNSRGIDIDDGPLANYENLSFALSLEHYENAKDLLRKAGVTQTELDAISANLRPTWDANLINKKSKTCTTCGHPQRRTIHTLEMPSVSTNDDYLMMEPNVMENKLEQTKPPLPSGYTPMSPIGGFSLQTLKYPAKSPISRLLDEKSASNPTLCAPECNLRVDTRETGESIRAPHSYERNDRIAYRKRPSSADSSRFLEDVKEFESNAGSRGSTSSIETLRHITLEERAVAPCGCLGDGKHSDADSSEASKIGRGDAALGAGGGASNRDSSSSNDSGVSSCSLRRTARHCRTLHEPPRRSKSTDPLRDVVPSEWEGVAAKSSSAEAEVPVLTAKPPRGGAGVACPTDTRSTSSGASDLSDYMETLSVCSSQSSSDTPLTTRVVRHATSTLRPRSGGEYLSVEPRLRAHTRPH